VDEEVLRAMAVVRVVVVVVARIRRIGGEMCMVGGIDTTLTAKRVE
jgi:hypothetical protein